MLYPEIDALRPYLNPAYWDGHSLGTGPMTGPANTGCARPTAPDSRFAARVIREEIGHRFIPFPLQTYIDGSTFNIADQPPGTIVLFRDEALVGKAFPPGAAAEAFGGLPVEQRPKDALTAYDEQGAVLDLSESGVHYTSSPRLGVVPPDTAKGELVTLPAAAVHLLAKSCLRVMTQQQLTIGKPTHTAYTKIDQLYIERLSRVNSLHVVKFGDRNLKGKKIFNMAFGFKPIANRT